MALTDIACRSARPKDTAYKLSDAHGLYLLVKPAGGRYWRLDYRFAGKRKTLALGVYPEVSLKAARDKREEGRRLLSNGIDPGEYRKVARISDGETFEAVAREWFAKFSRTWTPTHASRILRRLERDIFPRIGSQPAGEITAPKLLEVLRRIEHRGAVETAHRALQNCGQIFRYAVATGRAERDPSGDLRGALPPVKQHHHPSIIDPGAIGELLRAIDGYEGSEITRCALQWAPLVFVRPGELRHAEWDEINFDTNEWRIPAEKMKMRAVHIVPLSVQAKAVLEELQPLTGIGRYLFPSTRGRGRPMSENTVNAALRRLGYAKDQMTGHGFRSMASTLLNEQGFHRDAIERQLAHGERDKVRAAYNYAKHLPERHRMMQAWANYLDALRDDRKIVAIHRA